MQKKKEQVHHSSILTEQVGSIIFFYYMAKKTLLLTHWFLSRLGSPILPLIIATADVQSMCFDVTNHINLSGFTVNFLFL